MVKYIKVPWPEYQDFMTHPDFYEKCFFCVDDNSYFIPEDLFMNKLEFPKKYENTNLGTIVCYETRAVVNGEETFWYDHNPKKGDKVLIYNHPNDAWKIVTCIANQEGFPMLIDSKEGIIGFNEEIIGSYDPEVGLFLLKSEYV